MILRLLTASLIFASVNSCNSVAITGRKQFAAFNDGDLANEAAQSYK